MSKLIMEPVATVSQRLRIAVEKSGKTQAEIVRETGINKASLSRYLKGAYAPKSTALYKLALALDVSDMWLEGYDVPMERSQKNSEPVNYLYEKISHDAKILTAISQYYNLPVDIQNSILNLIESVSKNTMGR